VVPITVAGVPAHPLLVHAVVVLIPLAALGAVALAVRPAWGRPYGPLVAAGALGGAVTATLAKFAGDQLEAALDVTPAFAPVIARHSEFGLYTLVASWPFAVLAVGAAVLGRREGGRAARVVGALAAVAGLVAVVLTVLAGHTGSEAVWGFVTE
jgi:energy-converting hydrogenase Eha subunit A